MQETLAFLT